MPCLPKANVPLAHVLARRKKLSVVLTEGFEPSLA
jgi:hypothetical protein